MTLVPDGYHEQSRRLALGVTPVDILSGVQPIGPLRIEVERGLPHESPRRRQPYCVPQFDGRPPKALCRHGSGRFALLYQPGVKDSIDLRIHDHYRWYVPRRLRLPLLTLTEVEAREAVGTGADLNRRSRSPRLYPGAAYPVPPRATGLRGRVLRDNQTMRWVWVEAIVPGSNPERIMARTRGDDRGEFLLLLPPPAVPEAELPQDVSLHIEISGPAAPPDPSTAPESAQDPFWDLPQEQLATDTAPDPVADGTQAPAGYQRSPAAGRNLAFPLGRILTGADVPDFIFSLP